MRSTKKPYIAGSPSPAKKTRHRSGANEGIREIPRAADLENGNAYVAIAEKVHMAPVPPAIMKKYVVDVGLGVSFFLCFFTGIMKLPGFLRFFHRASIDIPLDQMSMLHDASGVIMGIFALVHLALNRKWMASVTRKLMGRE